MFTPTIALSLLIFFPALSTILIALIPKNNDEIVRLVTLGVTLIVMLAVVFMCLQGGHPLQFDIDESGMQMMVAKSWIPSFDISYLLGLDGISFPLVVLTGIVSFFAMIASWSIKKHVKGYCILFLLLLTGMLGVFMALDFFLFYVFWEVMLLPMYFLIGVWGGPRKEYAAIKFFLFTLMGSVLMLVAILMLYFNSDLTKLNPEQLVTSGVAQSIAAVDEAPEAAAARLMSEIGAGNHSKHTFNILALSAMGQTTDLFDGEMLFGWSLQRWAFILLFIGFVIKVPSVPVHTWLPDAHVEAPTPISMILAGVLLKMGGYGLIRICYPICPQAGFDLAWIVCLIGVVSMVYGALAALAQKDFKRMVAYSSVSHMGYVVLGLGVWTVARNVPGDSTSMMAALPDWQTYWNMGVKGAMFQMIGHGVSSAGMFFMVGVVYDRVHHRNLEEFGGLYGKMPLYTALAMGIFFAGLGLPGLCGFIGEVLVVLSVWNFSGVLAVISAFVVILTAAYILWAIQRVYLGAEYKGPHEEDLSPINLRECCVAIPLLLLAIWFGVYPKTVFQYMDKTIDAQVQTLADWTPGYVAKKAAKAAEAEAAAAALAPAAVMVAPEVNHTSNDDETIDQLEIESPEFEALEANVDLDALIARSVR